MPSIIHSAGSPQTPRLRPTGRGCWPARAAAYYCESHRSMPRKSEARQKMIESAALLFRERGIHGTSFADVLAHSGAPRGSVYHHFSGGKTQLAEETIRWA